VLHEDAARFDERTTRRPARSRSPGRRREVERLLEDIDLGYKLHALAVKRP
jgi:hypothetical protein